MVQALVTNGCGETELFAPAIEPFNPMTARRPAARPEGASAPPAAPPADPAARAAAMRARMNSPEVKKAREDLRQWRLSTPMDYFKGVAKKFQDAGVRIDAYTQNYRDDYTDEEIEKTFEQCKALGCSVIATSTQMPMAKRLLPMAEKHKLVVAFHGHSNTKDPNEFATPESFQAVTSMSKYFKINLDIGHFFAAGFDPVAYIQEHHELITHLHVKDRKKNDGPNTPWGEGDTPIQAVLVLLRDKKYPIPALVEYEYRGTGTPVEEVQKCMDFMKKALA
ncbi:MAG: sugar phosphate isomerase/epimerase [Acidobacteriaceae bacterium]|nr:sugar phosphate isomerase/epimerase [Acidobacteriaceae bacterium]